MVHEVPFSYDAWKLAAPEDPEVSKACGGCLFCKDLGSALACVVEVFDAEDEDELYDASLHAVECTQEACDCWTDAEG